MKNPLGKEQTRFATPESADALQAYVGRFSGGEAVAANVIMMMTWNYAVSLIDEALKDGRLISPEE